MRIPYGDSDRRSLRPIYDLWLKLELKRGDPALDNLEE